MCSLEPVLNTFCCYVLSGKYEYCQGDVREMSGNFEEACCYEPCKGTILACRCAMSWLFAHGSIMGMPMGMIKAPGIFNKGFWKHVDAGTQQSNYLEPSWPVGVQRLCPSGPHGCDKRSWNLVHRARDPPVICLFWVQSTLTLKVKI